MANKLIPKREIEQAKTSETIIRDTAEQVIKDFATFGMEVHFPDDLHFAYDNLFEQLKIILFDLIRGNSARLSPLLYQIDVDEKKIRKEAPELLGEHEWMAEIILEREFMKVLTRHYFKKHYG